VAEGVVYVGVAPVFVALDALTGKEVWKLPPLAYDWISCLSSPAVSGDAVYVSFNWSSGFFALNSGDGSKIWNGREGFSVCHATPCVSGSVVYHSADSKLRALDSATGNEIWNFPITGWSMSSPAFSGSTVYIGTYDGTICAVTRMDR